MKITKDGKGRFIVDFEGTVVDVSDIDSGSIDFISNLFSDRVSMIMNGIWQFDKNRLFNDIFQKDSHRPTDKPEHVHC